MQAPEAGMDEMVLRALARWPQVPAVHGWLALDRRGRWRVRGEPLTHPHLVAYIGRNYAADEKGRWFFQNGPQRVYVTLDYTPWVHLLDAEGQVLTHTGRTATPLDGAWLDEEGSLLLAGAHGVGVLDDRDLAAVSRGLRNADGSVPGVEALEALLAEPGYRDDTGLRLDLGGRTLAVGRVALAEAAERLGFDPHPREE